MPTAQVEADLAALKQTAERAGTTLACLFSSSDEFEAEVIRVRRQRLSAREGRRGRSPAATTIILTLLTFAFLML